MLAKCELIRNKQGKSWWVARSPVMEIVLHFEKTEVASVDCDGSDSWTQLHLIEENINPKWLEMCEAKGLVD